MNKSKIQYAQEVSPKTPGNTGIYRSVHSPKELTSNPAPGIETIQDAFLDSCKRNPDATCLGTQNAQKNGYDWKTYSQVKKQAEQLGTGILKKNLAPEVNEYEDYKLKLIGIYSRNREEWITLDVANILYGNVIIPLYDTLGPDTISYVIGHSAITSIFVEKSVMKNLWKAGNLHNIKTIIQFETAIDAEDLKAAQEKGIEIINYESVMKAGEGEPAPYAQVKKEDCFTFSYTSGTTGDPKGAMLSHQNLVSIMASVPYTPFNIGPGDVHLSYLPLPHILERLVAVTLLYRGCSIGFYGGDVLKLKDDLALLKPTLFVSVPRLYNKFYSRINANLSGATGCKKCLIDKGGLWDGLVFKKTKAVLGGRVTRMITGSAPISGEVLQFMKVAMCCPFIEGYGQTESTGASFCVSDKDSTVGHVGGVVTSTEFKLEDVPDMNCTSEDKDKETGEPAPRGEICLRGPQIFMGYYKDRKKTEETVDKDGWLHTGDVGTILPNGALKIIDRKKNIFKLSQGEYVAPEKVENTYLRARGVAEVFLHGDSLQNYAVGIIVPDPDILKQIGQEKNITGSTAELCQKDEIIAIYLKNCIAIGKAEGLKGFEQAKRLHLEPLTFAEKDCVTNTGKLQRHKAKLVFKSEIDGMYAKGDPAQAQPSKV